MKKVFSNKNVDFTRNLEEDTCRLYCAHKSAFFHNAISPHCSVEATLDPARKLIIRSYYCRESNDHSFEIRVDSSKAHKREGAHI